MQTVSEYRKNAQDCRELAKRARDDDGRKTLLKMGDTWEAIANQRVAILPIGNADKRPRVN